MNKDWIRTVNTKIVMMRHEMQSAEDRLQEIKNHLDELQDFLLVEMENKDMSLIEQMEFFKKTAGEILRGQT